ncbi:MAG TPA: beta-ketoacyl synthase N-terminal-like domain-containing protein, partial [Polyangiaceae bacterium]|nr:beta-ketoacyl synthase N-terminal-like domain-containing protein [Polyangiaceae bacterium]
MKARDDVAIVGMAVVFPGGPGTEAFWSTVAARRVATRAIPASRISPTFFGGNVPERFRLERTNGGFLSETRVRLDWHGMIPRRARLMDPEHAVALTLAEDALLDAGIAAHPRSALRGGVVLGRTNTSGPGRLRLENALRGGLELEAALALHAPALAVEARA